MTSQLLLNESPLLVLPTLAKIIGLNEAIVLQQIHYWLQSQSKDNDSNNHNWVCKTYERWKRQFPFLSERTLRRTIKNLEASNLILAFRIEGRQTKLYTINYPLVKDTCTGSQNVNSADIKQQSSPKGENLATEVPLDYPCCDPIKEPLDSQNEAEDARDDEYNCLDLSSGSEPEKINGLSSLKFVDNKVVNINGSKWPDRPVKLTTIGQNDHPSWPKWPPQMAKMTTPTGQIGHHTIKENTREITTENTPPPLSPPPQILTQETQEEDEENQQTNFGLKSQNNISDQTLSPATSLAFQTMEEELTDQEPQIYSKMIGIWNQTVHIKLNPGQEVHLTEKRKGLLKQYLNEVFSSIASDKKMDAWQNYCNLIAKSRFLLGQNANGFKVTLDWALIPDNAYKVLEGAIYDKPETHKKQQEDLSWEEFSEEIVRSAPSSKYLTQWVKMSISIARFIGQQKYKHWFSRVNLSEVTDTTATFLVEGNLTKDIITRQYSSELRCAVQQLYPTVHQFEFKVVSPDGESS